MRSGFRLGCVSGQVRVGVGSGSRLGLGLRLCGGSEADFDTFTLHLISRIPGD